MLWLVNTDLGFSLEKNLAALVDNILLKQDIISYMSAKDLMSTGIREKTLLVTLSGFLN